MMRCKNCILPETARGVKFDDNGLCQLCKNYKEFVPKGQELLLEEMHQYIQGKGDYNCIVPVSGGRDSSYALYYAKEILGLKALAVHNDNDFETDIANKNLDAITKNMGVPLIRISSKSKISKKIVAEKFKMNSSFGPWVVVFETCEACEYGYLSAAYNTAKKKNIQLIIWGDSKDESTQSFYDLCPHDKRPTKWDRLIRPGLINVIKYKYYFSRMKKEYGSNSSDGLKEIHLFDYIRWDRKVIVDTIKDRLKWSVPAGSPTTWRLDCSLVPLVDYLTEAANGVSKIELGFSNMVRSGKMDRNDALKQVEQIKKNRNLNQLKMYLMDIGIHLSLIDRVFNEGRHRGSEKKAEN
jgi:glucosamine--fructose-6-phosphate aminotransferase (isomerizing)